MAEPSSKPQKESRAKRFRTFCYDGKTNQFCGRTCLSWLLLLVYYLFAWGIFVALFVIILHVDFEKRDKNDPQFNVLTYQPILQEPGLSTVPRGEKIGPVNVIKMSKAEAHIKEINAFLKDYPRTEEITDCKGNDPKQCDMKKDGEMLGPCSPDADPTFGYKSNEPCVVIKVNKLWGWRPELYKSRPESLQAAFNFSPTSMPVSCEAWKKLKDKKFLGNFSQVTINPPSGLLGNCFPYCGRKRASVQPFVMAKFRRLDRNHTIGVLCVIHASNVKDSRKDHLKIQDQIGSIIFALSAKSIVCNLCLASILFYLPLLMLLHNVQLNI